MSEKSSENSDVSDVAFAQDVMRGYVDSRPGTNVKEKLAIAARSLSWSFSRVRSVFYGEARRIEANEMEQLCRAATVKRQVRELADEHEELTARLARMEAMLADLMATVEGRSAHAQGQTARGSSAPLGA